MAERPRGGIGKVGAVAIAILMVVIAIGVGTIFESQGPPVTSALSSSIFVPAGCSFYNPSALPASSALNATFSGCLTSSASGSYLIAATGQERLNMTGTITAQYPIQITIGGADIANLSTSAGTVYTANDTTSVSLPGITLLPQTGYAITMTNQGRQNNTVTMSLQIVHVPGTA